ncbi:copper amine oxidase N-terminal domain-containing protein [Cohnella zeiphila]|uniref:Copper amine oxidase N-terminal domain-containing protein n=1 Tax=Cohnella zeiphila TaxID=2761120 RepID=A0A7X0SHR5_9BACL|nr:copper amine oxidase N-terminal domain-containing protein [Cohnella zeiphila]MBB6730106.1 copper amine oxidase N-terminal domain-containing protein [Cohnella zeiphila]
MKKVAMLTAAAMLFAGMAGTASAAGKAQPIQVELNGAAVTFDVPPTTIGNTTFVEFRSLFAQLGYQVNYDAKTKKIDAKSDEHEIQMTLGGDVAFVDGKTVPIDGQLKTSNGRTVVGVRFIAMLSGKKVDWIAASSTVRITDSGPTAEQAAAVYSFLDKSEAAKDADSYMALVAEDSPLRDTIEQYLPEQLKEGTTKTEYLDKQIVSYSPTEVILDTKEHTVWESGKYYFPNTTDMEYTLHPNASGDWVLYDLGIYDIVYDDPDALLTKAADVPDADKQAIDDLLKAQNDAINAEDMDKLTATYEPFDGLDDAMEQVKAAFDQADVNYEIEKTAVVDYGSGGNSAVVVQSKILTVKGSDAKFRIIQGDDLVKKDGKWLFGQNEYVLKQEQL